MSKQRKRLIIVCVLLFVASIAGWRVVIARRHESQRASAMAVLEDLKINPKTLAAAGVDVGHAQSVIDAAMKYARSSECEELHAAATAYEDSGRSEETGKRVRKALDDCFVFVTMPLSPSQRQTLSCIRAQVESGLPVEFITIPRTDNELTVIRAALRSDSTDGSFLTEMQSEWARIQAEDAVAVAKDHVKKCLTPLRGVWRSAFPRAEAKGQDLRPWWDRLW